MCGLPGGLRSCSCWSKISGHGLPGALNVAWDGSPNMLLVRAITRGGNTPRKLLGVFLDCLLERHGKRIASFNIQLRWTFFLTLRDSTPAETAGRGSRMAVPDPTSILRFIHINNLEVALRRCGLHAPNHTPDDGLAFKTIHDTEIQDKRKVRGIPCGPGGVIHDYVPFYFGYLSPMMFLLHKGRVAGYAEGQEPLIYLVSSAQAVQASGAGFVFSNGHGIAAFTDWYDDLAQLDQVDWDMVYQQYWADNTSDMDRQRRKQAEFLIHKRCDWSLIQEIAVINAHMKTRVEQILAGFDAKLHRPVAVRPGWYY